MTASKLIALRSFLAIFAMSAYAISPRLAYLGLFIFGFCSALDWVDGLLAERKNQQKPFGGFLDISADQCTEYLMWIVFLHLQLVPIWIPAFIVIRNSFINLLRVSAISQGQAMFGDSSMITSPIGRLIVGARTSRGIMVMTKMIGFLGVTVHYSEYGGGALSAGASSAWLDLGVGALYGLALIHLVRGVIIIAESKALLPQFLWTEAQASRSIETSQ